jgi:MOSC domain-containing protein YiiM
VARIVHLFRAPKKRAPMEELHEVQIIGDVGLHGCAHARPGGKRQLLLMDVETLRALDLTPGIIRENITTEGLQVNGLQVGQRLRVGAVELEVSAFCEPCELMEEIRAGLKSELQGRREMLCRVLRGGTVKTGDPIASQPAAND